MREFGWNEHFAFIAGFTEGGFPFGVTWEEMRELQAQEEKRMQARKERPMRTLSVDMNDLEMAFEARDGFYRYYLDTETGRVMVVPGYEYDGDVSDEMAEALEMIDSTPAERFLSLESDVDLRPSIDDALEFVEGVEDGKLRSLLSAALRQRHRAFRRFLDLVESEAGEAERWHYVRRQCLRKNIVQYLQAEHVSVVYEPLPPFTSRFRTREHLLAGAKAFVDRVSRMAGVKRIAMIGSLTTVKREPNDVDLLVAIALGASIEQIAAAGRKLKGHCAQINRGADVFLATDDGRYLGRTCPWRECAPGLRMACEALHCGTHLYDDLHRLHLSAEVVGSPPLEIWPAPLIRGELPEDLLRAFHIVGP